MRTLTLTLAGLLLAFVVAGCGATPGPADGPVVDEARATEIALGALEAFNAGDYAGWTRDWSSTMRSAIPEDAFRSWHGTVSGQLGAYVSLGTPERSSRQPGTYRWSFPVSFERGSATFALAFAEGRAEVEGVFVE